MGLLDDIFGTKNSDIQVHTDGHGDFTKLFPNTVEGRERAHAMFDTEAKQGHNVTESTYDSGTYQTGSFLDGFFGAGGKK